jgi:cysteine desulfurase/selenocysteine lyase
MNIAEKTRKDFLILQEKYNNLPLVYFDNACQSLRPQAVINAINDYYVNCPVCAGRSNYRMANMVTDKIAESRQILADFIGADSSEIIFTRNTTEGINLLARTIDFKAGDIVLTTDKEHNSNLVPWQMLVESKKIKHEILPSINYEFSINKFEEYLKNNKVRLVAFVAVSNLDGTRIPIEQIIQIAHKYDAEVLLDGAQLLLHERINVKELKTDYLAFSGHKMLGPSGIGGLFVKKNILDKLVPFMVGGDTVQWTTYTDHEFLPGNEKFEAGLQDSAGIIGFGEAARYLSQLNYNEIKEHVDNLNKLITDTLLTYKNVKIIGPEDYKKRGSIINFYIEGVDVHQLSIMLDRSANIMVRSGQHCVHSWFAANNIKNSLRISLAFYNNENDVKIFINNFAKIIKFYL